LRAYALIKKRFGAIHGVVHSALVLADRSLAQMDRTTFEAALASKAAITAHLDAVFGDESLDFMLLFSSLQSFAKAAGQSNYAAGCCHADALAQQLRQRRPYPVKVMNWGYWGSIGIVASESYRRRMEQAGFGSIEPADAMAALERLLSAPVHQMVFVKATHPNVINALDVSDREQVKVIAAAPAIRLKPRSKRADEPRRSEVMQPA
jgi:hypothetical protein